jgi:hypothetical protein
LRKERAHVRAFAGPRANAMELPKKVVKMFLFPSTLENNPQDNGRQHENLSFVYLS